MTRNRRLPRIAPFVLILMLAVPLAGACSVVKGGARTACEKFIDSYMAGKLQEAVSLLHPNAVTGDFFQHKFASYEFMKKDSKGDKIVLAYEFVRKDEKTKYTFTMAKENGQWRVLAID